MKFFIVGICMVLAFNMIESSPDDSYDPETFSESIPKIKKPKLENTLIQKSEIVEKDSEKRDTIENSQISEPNPKKELVSCEPLHVTDCQDCGELDCKQLNIKIKRDVLLSILGDEIPDTDLLSQMDPSQVERLLESLVNERYQGIEPFYIVWQNAIREELQHHTCMTYEQYCYDYALRMEEARAELEPLSECFEF